MGLYEHPHYHDEISLKDATYPFSPQLSFLDPFGAFQTMGRN